MICTRERSLTHSIRNFHAKAGYSDRLLALQILQRAKQRNLPAAEITFDCSGTYPRVAALQPYVGQSGDILAALFTVESLDQVEDYLIVAAISDGGEMLAEETARRMFSLPSVSVTELPSYPANVRLEEEIKCCTIVIQQTISNRNADLFEAEADKLDHWADDLKVALEREIKDFDRQIKEAKRSATLSLTLEEKLAGQKQIKALEGQRNNKRKSLFEAQDEVDQRRERLIADIEGKLAQKSQCQTILNIRWLLT